MPVGLIASVFIKRNDVLQPRSASAPAIKGPRVTSYIPSTPLRDLALHEKYGAAVDISGDVWMWGAGHFDDGVSEQAAISLRGKVQFKLFGDAQ